MLLGSPPLPSGGFPRPAFAGRVGVQAFAPTFLVALPSKFYTLLTTPHPPPNRWRSEPGHASEMREDHRTQHRSLTKGLALGKETKNDASS